MPSPDPIKKSCRDRARHNAIRELRSWRDRVLSARNAGVKRWMIRNRPEVEQTIWDWGWTTCVNLRLDDGYEISLSSVPKGGLSWPYEDSVAMALYRVLGHRYRDKRI